MSDNKSKGTPQPRPTPPPKPTPQPLKERHGSGGLNKSLESKPIQPPPPKK